MSEPNPLPVYQCLSRAGSEDQLLADMALAVKEQTECDGCDLLLGVSGGGLVLRASTISPEFAGRVRLGRGVGLVGSALEQRKLLMVPRKLGADKRYVMHPGIHEPAFESAVVTLIPGDGEPLGVMMLRRFEPWRPTQTMKRGIEEIAQAVGGALRGYRSAFEAGQQSNKMGVVTEVARTITASPYIEEILQLLVNLTAQRFHYKVVTIRLLDEKRGELVLRATQAANKAYQNKRAIKLTESIAGRAIRLRRPITVFDVQSDPEYVGHDLAAEQGLKSMICVPLLVQERPLGVMSCYTDHAREFEGEEIEALMTLASQAAVSIEHAKLQVRHTLMQEMHHRVKNNLQQVASLLRLQLRHGQYSTMEEALNDSLARILAIASVHELLGREDLDHVSIKSVVEMLVQHQQQSFIPPTKRITFEVRGIDVYLATNQATQVSLILNELVQNAIEHGFENRDQGEVHISVEEKNGEIGLWVSNNGDPLPAGFDPKTGSLGMQIVTNLARALGGTFLMEDRLGWTVCEVKFARTLGE